MINTTRKNFFFIIGIQEVFSKLPENTGITGRFH